MRDLSSIAQVEELDLTLRLIQSEDTAYVKSLRSNPTYNTHFSKVTRALPNLVIEHTDASPKKQKTACL